MTVRQQEEGNHYLDTPANFGTLTCNVTDITLALVRAPVRGRVLVGGAPTDGTEIVPMKRGAGTDRGRGGQNPGRDLVNEGADITNQGLSPLSSFHFPPFPFSFTHSFI